MRKLILIIFFAPIILSAQTDNKLSFDFGVGTNTYKMRDLNKYLLDSFAIKYELFDKRIVKGNNYFINIKYQPHNIFDIGVFANYQLGFTKHIQIREYLNNEGIPVTLISHNKLQTQAIGVGLTNSWYINYLLNFQNKKSKFLRNSKIATEINAGIGFTNVSLSYKSFTNDQPFFFQYYYFVSTDFQGHFAIKYEYDYIESPVIGTIGLKAGYQYFKTKTLKDKFGEEYVIAGNHNINADFSGFFLSSYISFGK